MPRPLNQTSVLFDLARAEILLTKESTDFTGTVTLGSWLLKLEKHASDHDLPGVKMQIALLKSDFYQDHGQLKDAHSILLDALNITDSPGVKTLRKKITEKVRELTHLIKESEGRKK